MTRDQWAALAYAGSFFGMGCFGYVLGVIHARIEARR